MEYLDRGEYGVPLWERSDTTAPGEDSPWQSRLAAGMLKLPSDAELKTYISDDGLDLSNPRTEHYIAFS